MKNKNIMVIVNPKSGKSKGKNVSKKIEEQLKEHFEKIEIKFTSKKGEATTFTKEACEKDLDSVMAVGGDGTLAEVICGMIEYENPPKLAVFPLGTGNIFSKYLYINQNEDKVIESIDFSKTQKMDIGKIGDNIFSFMLSIGQVTESLHDVTNEEKDKFGMFAYISNVLKHITDSTNYELRVKVDDYIYEGNVDHLFISTSDYYGKFKIQQADSSINDGKLNVFIVKKKEFLEKAKAGFSLLTGFDFDKESIEILTGEKILIESLKNEEIFVDLDGDKGPKLPVEITTISDKIKFYVGKDF